VHLYLLCGLAFAGKSTLAAQLASRAGATIVSLDDINAERGLHGGIGIPGEEWVKTHHIALARVRELLDQGRPVIVDDTNCFRWLRDNYRKEATERGLPTTVVRLEVSVEEALARARRNEATKERPPVTEAVLRDLAQGFEWPGPDENTVLVRPAIRWDQF
jgi:predicted kinase